MKWNRDGMINVEAKNLNLWNPVKRRKGKKQEEEEEDKEEEESAEEK